MEFGPRKKLRVGETKAERLQTLGDEIQSLAGRVAVGIAETGAVFQTAVTTAGNTRPLKTQLPELDPELVRGLAKTVVTSNNLQTRFASISKVMHAVVHQHMHALELKLQATKDLLALCSQMSVVSSYASENGDINWTQVHEDLLNTLH